MKCTNTYKKFTIRNLYKTLEEIMACNPEISLDTEILISDMNMTNFKQEVKVYPTMDYKDRQMKVGLFLNPYEKDELLEDIEQEELKAEQATVQVTEQVTEQATKQNNWFEKYTRS